MSYVAIIPAAGQGKRMKAGKNKLLLEVESQPILVQTVSVFDADPDCTEIIIVMNKDEEEIISSLFPSGGFPTPITLVHGGAERQHSVYNGLMAVRDAECVLVHDGARPFITQATIKRVVAAVKETGAAICGVPVKDTIKRVCDGKVEETVERSQLWSVQTPQGFTYSILKEAHEKAEKEAFLGTDEASLVERTGRPVAMVLGEYENIKVTTPEDLLIAEAFKRKKV